jgi:hypothetical protein
MNIEGVGVIDGIIRVTEQKMLESARANPKNLLMGKLLGNAEGHEGGQSSMTVGINSTQRSAKAKKATSSKTGRGRASRTQDSKPARQAPARRQRKKLIAAKALPEAQMGSPRSRNGGDRKSGAELSRSLRNRIPL